MKVRNYYKPRWLEKREKSKPADEISETMVKMAKEYREFIEAAKWPPPPAKASKPFRSATLVGTYFSPTPYKTDAAYVKSVLDARTTFIQLADETYALVEIGKVYQLALPSKNICCKVGSFYGGGRGAIFTPVDDSTIPAGAITPYSIIYCASCSEKMA
jgi:hypothetical protein